MTLIKTTIKNHVLLIELNRTEKMNAFASEMLEQLADAYTSMENDENVRCGLVFSKGEHFTALNIITHILKYSFQNLQVSIELNPSLKLSYLSFLGCYFLL